MQKNPLRVLPGSNDVAVERKRSLKKRPWGGDTTRYQPQKGRVKGGSLIKKFRGRKKKGPQTPNFYGPAASCGRTTAAAVREGEPPSFVNSRKNRTWVLEGGKQLDNVHHAPLKCWVKSQTPNCGQKKERSIRNERTRMKLGEAADRQHLSWSKFEAHTV